MENEATLGQAMQLLTIMKQSGASRERLQAIISSGLLSDLLMVDPAYVNRAEFRKLIGLRIIDRIGHEQPWIEELKKRFVNVPGSPKPHFVYMSHEMLPSSDPSVIQKPTHFSLERFHCANTGEVLGAIRAVRGRYRAATYQELLAYQQEFPEDWELHALNAQDLIVALGSVTSQGGYFPAVARRTDGWHLQVHNGNMACGWPKGTKFLLVQRH